MAKFGHIIIGIDYQAISLTTNWRQRGFSLSNGLSAGRMLTCHSATLSEKAKGIVGKTFLDQQVSDNALVNIGDT